jgi:6-pyruvoyltetrahydropterin/6-carboxytetrahydropterin synthase
MAQTTKGSMTSEYWEIEKHFTFEASHQLPNHDGKCRNCHGHSWRGTVTVRSCLLETQGPQSGMVLDYGVISAALKPLVENYLDHHHLNETTKLVNPTSEELARWIYMKLIGVLPGLVGVAIHETCTSSCRYYPATV